MTKNIYEHSIGHEKTTKRNKVHYPSLTIRMKMDVVISILFLLLHFDWNFRLFRTKHKATCLVSLLIRHKHLIRIQIFILQAFYT